MKKRISLSFAVPLTIAALTACGNGPLSPDTYEDAIYDVSRESSDEIDFYNRENDTDDDYSYSGSSAYTSAYTNGQTTLSVFLEYYLQLKTMDDNGLSDGDPRISFTIKTYRDGEKKDSIKTSTINLGDNVGIWSDYKSVTVTLSSGINEIYVCPNFVDEDPFFDDKEYCSNYCYGFNNVGQKIGEEILQDDYMATHYVLKWYAVLDYK